MKQAPLYEQIYREILGKIQDQTYQAGERLPSEKELSEQYHVSRITSKKALELLAEAGLAVRMPGRGTFVSEGAAERRESSPGGQLPGALLSGQLSGQQQNTPPLLGVILDGFGPDFGCRLLGSIEEECRQQGFSMCLHCSCGQVEEETRAIGRMRSLGAQGILIMCVHDENYNASILQLVVEHYPVVTLDRQLKGIPLSFVGTDNIQAARQLAKRLLDQNLRRICFVKPYAAETSTIQDRITGFRMAYSELGLVADESLWITDLKATLPASHGEEQLARDREKVMAFIREHPQIEAYFAVEYSLAWIIYSCLEQLGLEQKCPVVCFDGTDNIMRRALFTHVRQDEEQIGRLGVRTLAEAVRGSREIRTVLVPHRIVEAGRQL
ncbi:MAG: GntR family transcriptional regulator [Eubacteriales bacterium]|nr:GntR family transcriptional regulator [Eubacteriales bacterium]